MELVSLFQVRKNHPSYPVTSSFIVNSIIPDGKNVGATIPVQNLALPFKLEDVLNEIFPGGTNAPKETYEILLMTTAEVEPIEKKGSRGVKKSGKVQPTKEESDLEVKQEKTTKQEKVPKPGKTTKQEKTVKQEKAIKQEKVVQQTEVLKQTRTAKPQKVVKQEAAIKQEKAIPPRRPMPQLVDDNDTPAFEQWIRDTFIQPDDEASDIDDVGEG
ncbi:hypothetical protein CONLIGDRAFT_497475 [Coniochaeta ligniaria NRRL 30616]|uniref:Uncharacterized protein n=1 Tax=Coniochaeta ligniaria NRRL 30616 TaxID=1408157 RepID=A0A1J7JD47_9PEZI|nr:hypothetical protein CONLIGDRAFT_497475 [Coniochaeta ligniaria NRRL 30616]